MYVLWGPSESSELRAIPSFPSLTRDSADCGLGHSGLTRDSVRRFFLARTQILTRISQTSEFRFETGPEGLELGGKHTESRHKKPQYFDGVFLLR